MAVAKRQGREKPSKIECSGCDVIDRLGVVTHMQWT